MAPKSAPSAPSASSAPAPQDPNRAARDTEYMARALRLARLGLESTDPNPRVGCVIVKDGAVVGEGWHRRAGEHHAEIIALQQAQGAARGADLYLTLEPCTHQGRTPPCVERVIAAAPARVIIASSDPNPRVHETGIAALRAAGIEVCVGVLADAARALNPGFYSRFERDRPWLRLKSAASMDGASAMADGASQWITGEAARADVQCWRARSSAVLTGIGTALADDPRLNLRRQQEHTRQPLRVVLDSQLRLPPTARLFNSDDKGGAVLVITCSEDSEDRARSAALRDAGAEVLVVADDGAGRIALPEMLTALAARDVNELLVECGAELAGALFEAELVDEWLLYLAPVMLGAATRRLAEIRPASLARGLRLHWHDVRMVGADLRIILRPAPPA